MSKLPNNWGLFV